MNELEGLTVLGRMTLAMSRASRLDEHYDEALKAIEHATGSRRAAVLLFDPDGVLRFKAWRGISAEYRTAIEGFSPWAQGETNAMPVLLPTVTRDSGLEPYVEATKTEGIAAMALLPLVSGGRVIGGLAVYYPTVQTFVSSQVHIVLTIASFTAFAIDRQRAVDQLEGERGLFVGGPTVIFKWRNLPGWPVEYASPNLMQQFGYTPEDLMSGTIPYASIVHPGDVDRVAAEVMAAIAGDVATFEQAYRLRRADGEYRSIYDFTVVTREHGVVTGFQGYLLDVTERDAATAALHDAEVRLREVQRLESLGVLAGGIAHDFNNLLVGVLGNASLALAELPLVSPARPILQAVQTAGRRGAELTRQLLAYSGKGKLIVEPVHLTTLVEEAGQLLATVIEKTATLQYRLSRELPVIEADATQIRQVVMNLLTNASDALEGRPGSIVVTTRREELERGDPRCARNDLPPGEYVVLEVRDTGIGMDEATVRRVFDPFFTTKFHGRGLGMAAVLGIVKGHRGAIRIDSAPNVGTTVSLYLPVPADARHIAVAQGQPSEAERPESGTTILIVDDEKLVRDVTARTLRRAGFQMRQAENGRAALDLLAAEPDAIHLVLLDLTMPEMSGEATLRHIREQWPELPVLLSSGYSADTSSTAIRNLGASFIQKPYMPEDLLAAIRAALAR
jgi:PAS domain S-box-containing protein